MAKSWRSGSTAVGVVANGAAGLRGGAGGLVGETLGLAGGGAGVVLGFVGAIAGFARHPQVILGKVARLKRLSGILLGLLVVIAGTVHRHLGLLLMVLGATGRFVGQLLLPFGLVGVILGIGREFLRRLRLVLGLVGILLRLLERVLQLRQQVGDHLLGLVRGLLGNDDRLLVLLGKVAEAAAWPLADAGAGLTEGTDDYETFIRFAQNAVDDGDPLNYAAAARTAHPLHLHPLSFISGTYYVATPAGCPGIKFEDPRLDRFMAAPPRRAGAKAANRTHVTYPAEAGNVILFESWLRHEVPSNRVDAERISISFNFNWR